MTLEGFFKIGSQNWQISSDWQRGYSQKQGEATGQKSILRDSHHFARHLSNEILTWADRGKVRRLKFGSEIVSDSLTLIAVVMDANDGPFKHAGYEFISSSGTFNGCLAYRVACIPISAFDDKYSGR